MSQIKLKSIICFFALYIISIIYGYAAVRPIVGTINRLQILNFSDDAEFDATWIYVTQNGNINLGRQSQTPSNAVNNRSQQIIFRVNNIADIPNTLNQNVRQAILYSINRNLDAIRLRHQMNPGNEYALAPGVGPIFSGGCALSSAAGQYFSQHNLHQITNSFVLPPYRTGIDNVTPFPGTTLPFYQRGDNRSSNQGKFNYTYILQHNFPNQLGAVDLYHTEPKAIFAIIQALALANAYENVLIISNLPMCPYCSRFLLNMLTSTLNLPNIVIISRDSFRQNLPGIRPDFITNANITNSEHIIDRINVYFDNNLEARKNLLIYEIR